MVNVHATEQQLQALEVFKEMIKKDNERRDYAHAAKGAGKKAIFNRNKGDMPGEYDNIPNPARDHLEDLKEPELKLLADLDATFVASKLSVETNPVPLMVH